jgi:hypothetical protein
MANCFCSAYQAPETKADNKVNFYDKKLMII